VWEKPSIEKDTGLAKLLLVQPSNPSLNIFIAEVQQVAFTFVSAICCSEFRYRRFGALHPSSQKLVYLALHVMLGSYSGDAHNVGVLRSEKEVNVPMFGFRLVEVPGKPVG
jgi:hypothetical protein